MLYHNIKSGDEERKIKIIEQKEKKNYNSTFYKKSTTDSWNPGDWNRQSHMQEKINMEKKKWKKKWYQR